MPSRRSQQWSFTVALLTVGALVAFGTRLAVNSTPPAARGVAGAQPVVREYLAALAVRDEAAIGRLTPPGYDVEVDVKDRLTRFGGLDATAAVLEFSESVTPEVVSVSIKASRGISGKLVWTENLVRRDGGWHIILGSNPRASPLPRSSLAPVS